MRPAWTQRDSNPHLPPCKGGALPLSYRPGATESAVWDLASRGSGSDGRTRTSNLLLNRELPYQLGYIGMRLAELPP